MATVQSLLPSPGEFYKEMQTRSDYAELRRCVRWKATITLQRYTRGWLIRQHVARLNKAALIIQTVFRAHIAKKLFLIALHDAVRALHKKRYDLCATRIQAAWRGVRSRGLLFCYKAYRCWLTTVRECNERRCAEAAEFRLLSRADDLRVLEAEAQRWLAFVMFKLHHLLRTTACAGIYSEPATTELSEFEKLLTSIKYTDYVRRLKKKYNEYVRRNKPHYHNNRLFPVIGDGSDYWYLSLPDLYELTAPTSYSRDTRGLGSHYDTNLHPRPFFWRRSAPPPPNFSGRGPFTASPRPPPKNSKQRSGEGDTRSSIQADGRFQIYVKHYKPEPDMFSYVDFHINVLLRKRCSLEDINI